MAVKTNKNGLFEHLDRIKYVSKYQINETPKYQALLGDSSMDSLPDYLKEAEPVASGSTQPAAPAADTQNPAPEASGEPSAPSTDAAPAPAAQGGVTPEPPPDQIAAAPADVPPAMPAPDANPMAAAPAPPPQQSNDDLQKLALTLLVDASKEMSNKISSLESMIGQLNQKVDVYGEQVQEVKEPTEIEKFENRKVDSHPYYFNLNDLWNNNTFKARMDDISKGYKQLEDGTYVADFDDLPKMTDYEVKQSFNQ